MLAPSRGASRGGPAAPFCTRNSPAVVFCCLPLAAAASFFAFSCRQAGRRGGASGLRVCAISWVMGPSWDGPACQPLNMCSRGMCLQGSRDVDQHTRRQQFCQPATTVTAAAAPQLRCRCRCWAGPAGRPRPHIHSAHYKTRLHGAEPAEPPSAGKAQSLRPDRAPDRLALTLNNLIMADAFSSPGEASRGRGGREAARCRG